MMLSTIFVVALSCTMYSSSQTMHMPREFDVETDSTWNLRLNAFATNLKNIENTLQYINEKSNNWAILKHNIDTWNAQVKDVDHKLTQIRQTQEEQQHKLTSLELILNHVLSKVIFLSEPDEHSARKHTPPEPVSLEDVPALERKVLTDLSAQLSNVLYHLTQMNAKHEVTSDTVRKQNDGHQTQSLMRKHAKHLEHMHELLKQIAAQQRSEKKSWQEMTSYYQSVSGELTTFTASLDLLLKRIELVVKNVYSKERGNSQHEFEQNDVIHANGTLVNNCNADQSDELSAEEADEYNKIDEEIDPVEYVQRAMGGCHELNAPRVDGIYRFLEPELNEVQRDFNERFCAFATDGPAWTVIQKRGPFATQENFNQSWHSYRRGFGSLTKDFWFGNEFIHKIVHQNEHYLRIELEDYEGMQVWAEYGLFRLDSESCNYQLSIGRYNGSIPDDLQYHNKAEFSTYDRANNQSNAVTCALGSGSGWWFNSNTKTNLNGVYHETPKGHKYNGIIWENWHGDYSLKAVRMLIRPIKLEQFLVKETIDD